MISAPSGVCRQGPAKCLSEGIPRSRSSRRIIFLIFFLSGVTGLIYEIAWAGMLRVIFGSSVLAIATVLTSFMAGLAIGSFYFGRIATRTDNPLRLYAWLETGIGAYVPVLISVFAGLDAVYLFIGRYLHTGFYLFALSRFFLCFLMLLPSTLLMGGTLPAMGQFVIRRREEIGRGVGALYGINTFGAVAGCIITGFVLVELTGLKTTIYLASFINLSLGGVTFLLCKNWAAFPKGPRQDPVPSIVSAHNNGHAARASVVLIAYALSGFTALAYEVVWTRVLSIIFFTTTYAFTVMLATMLSGLALGSFLFGRVADRVKSPILIFGILEMAIGLYAVFMPYIFVASPSVIDRAMDTAGLSWWGHLCIKFGASFMIMLVPCLLMGAAFPLVNRICISNMAGIGRTIGSLYSFNSIGCIFGSFTSGFIMIPILGLQKTIICLALINLTIGAAVLWFHKFEDLGSKLGILAASALIAGVGLMTIPEDIVPEVCAGQLTHQWRLSLCDEGIDGTTMILENSRTGLRRMMVNSHQYVGENSKIMMRVQKWQAHLPLLLHPDPENVLIVGMGTGITAGAASMHGVKLTACEISPGVLKAVAYFSGENRDVLDNPEVRIVNADGRNFLSGSGESYDVIIGDLYNAANAGVVNLYTKEYYELCKRHLTNQGLMCQWIAMKDFPEVAIKGVVHTFQSVFPHTTLWYAMPDIIAMIGSNEDLRIDLISLEQRLRSPELKDELREIGMDSSFVILSHFLINEKACTEYSHGTKIISDDKPYIEFSIPRSLHYLYFKKEIAKTLRHINKFRKPVVSPGKNKPNKIEEALLSSFEAKKHVFRAYAFHIEGDIKEALDEYKKALKINPADREASIFLKCLLARRVPTKR